ncbi:hypothetical protein ACJMK2_039447 [Sinanodonta woodiana]|uniref:Apolipophorin n=1 Tax=Sinanodonta woodiana TaxID=1069815 RepID=A0ABD3WFZ1_SINWO
MELTPVIFLALVAGCWAGPIAETISTEYTCATTCTGPSKFSYRSETTYVYQYDVETKTAVMGSFDHHSGLHMSAKVHIEVLNQCEFVMRLSDVVLSETNPDSPMEMKTLDSEFSRAMERNLLHFSFQDGRVEELCPATGDASWVLNVKRGVLSMFQNNMENLQNDQKVKETDVSGDCDTEYTVGEGDRYTTIVKKSKNLLGCRNRQEAQTTIQGFPYTSSSDIQSQPILYGTHECEQEINTRTQTIISAICRESYKFLPFSRESSGAVTNSTQKLTYVEERSGVSAQKPVDNRATLLFEHVNGVISSAQSIAEVEGRLVDICLNTKSGIQPQTPSLFAGLVYSLRKLDAASIKQLYQEIQRGSICPENNVRLSKFFLDAIPMVGTSSSLRMLTRLIVNKDVTGIEAEMWMTTMAFIQKPTMEMLTEIKPLLTMEDVNGKAMLAVSSLVNRLCLFNDACDSDPAVNEIISTLESKIGSRCRVNDATMKTVLLSLRAIGNAGHAHKAIPTLTKCFTPTTNPMEIRLSAVEAFRRISCNADWRAIEALFQNKEEDSELRIAAYRSLMECPTTNRLDIIKNTLQTEEVNQVGSYIWSHLTNFMETSDRHKQEIRSILEDDVLQKEFDLDKRKFSRNYEKSFFFEMMNTGAKFEGDLIWSTKSFIPRFGMVNLTIDLFGNTLNLLQLGGRLEGLEYFIESYFGPDGYFGENHQAAESTAVRSIRPEKISKIDRRLKSTLDQLKGSLYMRVFGNELRYISFNGQQPTGTGQDFDIFEMIRKISKGGDYTLSESFMFLDSSVIIPTSAGFPLNFTVNGTATFELKANGKFDIRTLSSDFEISGLIQPSGAIELLSTMSVDAFVTKSGLKMVSTLHTSSALQGKVQLSNGSVFVAELDMPQEKMNIISVKTAFFTVHRDVEKEQKMITNNRQTQRFCSGADLSKIVGLELCGELEFPNATMEANAPYFPLTGPVNMGLTLYKSDAHTGYRFQAKSIHTFVNSLLHLSFDTPGSRVNRALTADFRMNTDFQMDHNGTLLMDTPSLEISTPYTGTVSVKGVVKYNPFFPFLFMNENVAIPVIEIKYSISVGEDEYSLETRIEIEQIRPDLIVNPILSIRTPKGELVALGGSVSFIKEKGCNVNLVLDKAFQEQVSIKGTILTNTNKRGSSLTANVDVKSSLMKLILKGKFDDKPKRSLSSDIRLAYFIKPDTHNHIKFVTKLFDMSTKTLTKFRTKANLNVKKNPELNFKALMEMNHNYKHSEFDADINYGPDFKDQNRSIEVSAQLNHDIKGWEGASADGSINLKHSGQGLNFLLKGSHKHDRHELDSSVYLRMGKLTFDSSLRLSNNTKDMMSIAGEFALSIPGTDIKLTNTLTQAEKSTYTNDMNINVGKTSKNRIVTTVQITDDKTMQITLDVIFSAMQPMKVKGKYHLNQGNQRVQLEMIKDQLKYIVTVTGQTSPQYKIVMDTQYPTRHVIATLDGSRTGDTYNGSFDLKWDVDRDDSLSITLIGKGRFASIRGFEGSLTTRYPSREIILNVRHLADTKYISSIDFQWEPKKVLSLQGSLTQRTAAKSSQLVADIGFSSPFHGYRDVSLKVRNTSDPSHISYDIDFAWNPSNKISTAMSLKVPVSARNIDVKIFAKTPFNGFQQIMATLVHSVSDSSQTSAQLSWDKEFVKAYISFISNGNAYRRNMNGKPDVKSSSKSFKIISLSDTHKDDGHADASFGVEKPEVDVTFHSDKNIEGTLTIGSTSFKTIRVTFTHSGPLNAFRSHAESSFGDKKVESDIQFSWSTIVEGRFSLQSPWFSPIKASFEHSGAVSDFKSHAEVTLGSRTTSGDVRLNLLGKISGSMSVQSPVFDDVIATLEYNGDISNMRLEVTLSSENGRFSAMTVFVTQPNFNLEVVVATPVQGCERTSIAIRYDGYQTNFKCHAEIFIANKRSEGDLIFKIQPKLEGNIIVKTPFFKDTSIKFDAATSSASLEAHSTMLYGGERIFHLDANYQADNVIIANIEMTTLLQGFRQLGGNFNFDGNLRRFQTSFELRKETEKLISTRAMFESDNKLSGQLIFLTPVTSLLTGNFNHDGQLSDFKSDFDFNYGEMRMYANVMFRAAPTEGSIEIKTSFMSDTSGSFRFDGQPNNFKIHVNGKALGETGSSDMSFTTDNGITGNIKVQSSIPRLDNIEGSFSHVMGYKNIESNAKIYYSPGKAYEINGRVSWRKILEGTVIIKSPIVDWEQTSISVRHQGSFPNIQTHAEMIQSLQKFEIEVTLAFDGSSVGAIFIKTPITDFENMGVSFRRVGELSNLVAEAKVTYASQKTISGSYNHNIIGNKLQTRAIFTNPYTEDITLSYNQDGDFNNFASTLDAYMDSQNGLSTELIFKKSLQTIDIKSTATLILEETSISSRLALRHDGQFSNFKTTASANFMGKESKVEASLKSNSIIQGSMSIQTPLENFKDILLSFEHSWNLGKISTSGSIKYDVIKTIEWDFSHYEYNWHQLRTSLEVRTPFTGYEYNKVSYEHNGNKNGFRCNSQINCARLNITALFQASNIPMNFGLDVKTSILGYEEMSMKGKLESRSGMYSSEAKIYLSRDKVISLAGSVDLTVTPMTGKLQLTTPLQGFESMEARISHSGEWRNFETAIYLNTPFASTISTSLNFKHVNTRNGFSSHANFNWGSPVSQMMGYELSLDQETSRLKVRLFFPSRTLALMGTKRTNTYTSHTEGSFLWDADSDPNKKIAFTADIKPQDDFLKADVTLMMPTIGKDFKLGSEMVLNRRAVFFDGKTQLSFSTDSRKTLSVFTRLVDLSSGSFSKNYSFSLGISHPYSSVDISLKSHAGSSSDRVSAGFDLSYLTVRGETKSIGFNGELDSVRKQMTFKADTPLQNIQISGNFSTEAPYIVILRNVFDMTTELSLDPVGRAINVHMNYDIDNPRDALHTSARYINSSAVAAEMYHVTSSSGRITDGMVSLRLNTATLLHSRVHWRPSIFRDLRTFINVKSEKYMVNFQNTLIELRKNVHDEIYLKSRRINQVFDEDFAAFRQDLEALQAMYENNDYHLKDIVDSIIIKYQELNQLSVDYLVPSKKWTDYHIERMILPVEKELNGKNAYKYWEIEENVKLVLRKIYLTIHRAVEEELTFMEHFVNMSNSGITVYDPVNGEIQADIYLPIPLQSLDVLPVLNIRKYSNRINSYLPGSFDISFYIPDSDYKNWLPPYKGQATLEGSQITTFDGKTYTLSSSCTFILARDFKNGNFSIILKNDNEKEIIIIFQGKTIEMLKGGKILVDAEPKDMPYRYNNVLISTDGSMVTLDAKNNFRVDYSTLLDRYVFTMSGWYFGKIAGLLGSYDNEPSNDFITSFGKVIDDERRFSSTWDVGSGSCP